MKPYYIYILYDMGFSSFKNFAYQVAIPQKIIPITQTKQPYDVINTQDLFIYYSFNNGTFNSAGVGNYATGIGKVDSSFSGSNVVIENQTLKLPAGNNGLKINEVIPTSSSTGFTVAFYFKLNTYGNYNFFFTLQGNTSDERYYICLDANSNKFRITDNFVLSNYPITLNVWTHFCLTVETNGNSIVYLDKVPYTFNAGYPTFINVSGKNSIGIDLQGNGINGFMDEFRQYNRVITSTEVGILFDTKYSQ